MLKLGWSKVKNPWSTEFVNLKTWQESIGLDEEVAIAKWKDGKIYEDKCPYPLQSIAMALAFIVSRNNPAILL